MDAKRFDHIARSLSVAGTRRGAVRLLTTVPLFSALATLLGDGDAAAEDDDHGSSHRRHRRKAKHRHQTGNNKEHRQGKRNRKRKRKDQDTGPTACTTRPCPAGSCGSLPDGCRGTLTCGCAANQLCVDGACQVCTVSCGNQTPQACGALLQGVIATAAPGATIFVCPGTYQPLPSSGGEQAGFDISGAGRSLTLIGAGQGSDPATNTILDAAAAFDPAALRNRVITIRPGVATVTLRGLRLTGGAVQEATGTGSTGGGITNSGDLLTMTACTVTGNAAEFQGGGIANATDRTLQMTGCTVSGNQTTGASGVGGGINTRGPVTLTACVIRENTAANAGGGLFVNAAGHTITLDATVVGPDNAATNGGGIAQVIGTVNLINGSSVSGNTPDNCVGFSDPACAAP